MDIILSNSSGKPIYEQITDQIKALILSGELPGGLSDSLAVNGDRVLGMGLATAICLVIGSVVAAVMTPIYFKFGQTKATHMLPTIIVMLLVIPLVVVGNSGILVDGVGLGIVADFLTFIDDPAGLGVVIAAVVAFSFLQLAISAAVSLKIYKGRDL